MKKQTLLLSLLMLSVAQAGDIKCPGQYPAKETIVSDSPPGHQGSGLIRGAKLSSAYITVGELHSDPNGFSAMQLIPRRVKDGWDSDDHFSLQQSKWLVCVYGGDGRKSIDNPRVAGVIEWWEAINPSFTHCRLSFRELKLVLQKPSDWAATATCE